MNIKRLKQASLSDKQTWESKWKIDSPQAIAVHKAVMNVILTDMQPLSIVEDEGFVRLIRQSWPKYEMPGRKFFRSKLPAIDASVREKLKVVFRRKGTSRLEQTAGHRETRNTPIKVLHVTG